MACFNYNSTPAHPRKIFTIINKFVNDNIQIMEVFDIMPIKMPAEEWAERVKTGLPVWEEIERPLCFKIKNGKHNAAYCEDLDEVEAIITINFPEHMTEASKAVDRNAKERSNTLKGFSRLTFTILHEVGHFATRIEASDIEEKRDPIADINFIREAFSQANNFKEFQRIIQTRYCNNPCEKLATDWAIDWLSNEENRKKAKQFEKEFFKAWRGE